MQHERRGMMVTKKKLNKIREEVWVESEKKEGASGHAALSVG